MADNIDVTPGTGKTVSAEEITNLNGEAVATGEIAQRVIETLRTADGTVTDKTSGAGAVTSGTPRVTLASDDPGVAALAAIKTAIEILDNIVSGSEAQVDVLTLPAIPAGTNNIGDVDVLTLPAGTVAGSSSLPTGTNNIGDVDVLTLPALPAGTNNIGDVDVLTLPTLPAGDNNIGNVDVVTLPGTVETDVAAIKTAIEILDNIVSGSEAQVDIVGALPAGDNNIGNVDLASALPAGANTIGNVGLAPQISGGLTIYRNLDLDETGQSVKGSAGQVYGWYIYNAATTARYVKLYNTSSAPTVGSDTPVLTIPVPALSACNVEFTNGIAFGTGIGAGATTGVADANSGAPAANDVVVNLLYK